MAALARLHEVPSLLAPTEGVSTISVVDVPVRPPIVLSTVAKETRLGPGRVVNILRPRESSLLVLPPVRFPMPVLLSVTG